MCKDAIRPPDPAVRALNRDIVDANEPQIMRIVATVDALACRGTADHLIAPLRQRLTTLKPPRPLRFVRLLFHPLHALIVPAARWRPKLPTLPRTALTPMANYVRSAMGADGLAIEQQLSGRTTADTDVMAALGQALWPVAARIFAYLDRPDAWDATELGAAAYRPLADLASALLAQAVPLDALCAETAIGLLPLRREAIEGILDNVAATNQAALPAMLVVLLDRLPEAAALLRQIHARPQASVLMAAMDQATDLLLRQLDEAEATEARVAAGTLAEAGAAANHIATFLRQVDMHTTSPERRDCLRSLRQRLDAACQARFASGLENQLLAPLRHPASAADRADLPALETIARGLRVLETEARCVGGGAAYDLLLQQAAEAITCTGLRMADQLRLVEILAGSEAAFATAGLSP